MILEKEKNVKSPKSQSPKKISEIENPRSHNEELINYPQKILSSMQNGYDIPHVKNSNRKKDIIHQM